MKFRKTSVVLATFLTATALTSCEGLDDIAKIGDIIKNFEIKTFDDADGEFKPFSLIRVENTDLGEGDYQVSVSYWLDSNVMDGQSGNPHWIHDPEAPGEIPAYQYNYNGDNRNEIIFFLIHDYHEDGSVQQAYVADVENHKEYAVTEPGKIISENATIDEDDDNYYMTFGADSYVYPKSEKSGYSRDIKDYFGIYKPWSALYSCDEATGVISCNVPFYLWTGEPCGQFEITYKLVDNTFVCDTITYTPEIN